jgi:hypothetical protein
VRRDSGGGHLRLYRRGTKDSGKPGF